MLEVELDIFSGMPNPVWLLSQREEGKRAGLCAEQYLPWQLHRLLRLFLSEQQHRICGLELMGMLQCASVRDQAFGQSHSSRCCYRHVVLHRHRLHRQPQGLPHRREPIP
jgi:hypothetical protein